MKASPDNEFRYDVFLSHSSKDKAVVRPLAERLRTDGLNVWFDEWGIKPGDSIPAKIEEGLEHSRVLVLCMSANAFGSDWAQLEAGTFRFRDPLNRERRFIPLRFDDAPIKGSLAQFLHINWRPADREQEYPKLLETCLPPGKSTAAKSASVEDAFRHRAESGSTPFNATGDYLRRRRDSIEEVFSTFEPIHAFFFKVCVDYMSFVEILHSTLSATDADRTKYYGYIKEIGQRLHEMHLLEGRLTVVGAERAMRLMQQYRLQATEVNDMLHLQLPAMRGEQVKAVADELFRRKDGLYQEIARALKEEGSGGVLARPSDRSEVTASSIGNAWSGLRGVLQEYSTRIIKGILGKAGLPISRIQYDGTYKGPVLDEADKLVSSMTDAERDRFAVGCVQEIIAFERQKAANFAMRGVEPDDRVLRNLRQVLGRFGHNLTHFETE